jgi:hypothetical protein
MTEEIADFPEPEYKPGQGACSVHFNGRMLLLGGRHSQFTIGELTDCAITMLPQQLPEQMAFQSCTVSEDEQTVYICGNYYNANPVCYL